MVFSNCSHISTTVQMAMCATGESRGAPTGGWQAARLMRGLLSVEFEAALGLRAWPGGMSALMARLAVSLSDLGNRRSGAGRARSLVAARSRPLAKTSGSVRGSYGCGPSLTGGGLPWSGRGAETSDKAGKRSSR